MELDEFRLVSLDSVRKKQVYLFQFLSKLEKELLKQSLRGTVQDIQPKVEDDLMKCVMMAESGCDTLRKLLSKCYNTLYDVGHSKSMFDLFIKMQSSLGQLKDSKIKM